MEILIFVLIIVGLAVTLLYWYDQKKPERKNMSFFGKWRFAGIFGFVIGLLLWKAFGLIGVLLVIFGLWGWKKLSH